MLSASIKLNIALVQYIFLFVFHCSLCFYFPAKDVNEARLLEAKAENEAKIVCKNITSKN